VPGDAAQVRLLGPVDVVLDGESRPVRGLRRQAVLAALALQAGQVVGTDWLVEVPPNCSEHLAEARL
jgi:DNA-binding SARP family transcriptional activator